MLRDQSGELLVEFTDRIFGYLEVLDFNKSDPSQFVYTHYLVVRAIYDVVHLYTSNKTPIEALRLKRNTTRFELFDRSSNNRIGDLIESYAFEEGLIKLKIRHGDIEPLFNCHGYCFADSKYWINDDQVHKLLQGNDYLEAKDDIDVAIVVFSQEDTIKHVAKRHHLNSGFIYVSKAGIRGLQETTSLEEAARGLPYDNVKVYSVCEQ